MRIRLCLSDNPGHCADYEVRDYSVHPVTNLTSIRQVVAFHPCLSKTASLAPSSWILFSKISLRYGPGLPCALNVMGGMLGSARYCGRRGKHIRRSSGKTVPVRMECGVGGGW